MSTRLALATACLLATATLAAIAQTSIPPRNVAFTANYGKLPLSFEANQGQSNPEVKFLSRGGGYSLFLTDRAAVLALTKTEAENRKSGCPISGDGCMAGRGGRDKSANSTSRTDVVRMELAGASQPHTLTGAEQLPGTANYFIGNDSAQWHSNIPTYRRIKYTSVYPGIDLIYYGNQRQLEYDFVVAPGASPKPIQLHFAGTERLELDADGNLRVIAKNGEIAFHKPVVYQMKDGERQPIEGSFTVSANNKVAFSIGGYDQSRELVIDPTLAYSTYLGGSTGAGGTGIAVDSSGNAYVTGETADVDFPNTGGAYQSTNKAGPGVANAFITKINPTGTALVYSTYLGGTGNSNGDGDIATAIAVDSTGNSYVTGYAYSSNFPLRNAFQSTNKAAPSLLSEPFVTKINAAGTALVYSTYLGGSSNVYGFLQGDRGLGITVNAAGNAYVTGTTYSTDFPVTSGAFQAVNNARAQGSNNGFVTKLSTNGETLVYSTYLGGSAGASSSPCCTVIGDGGRGIAVDASGDAFVAGLAGSTNFPVTSGAFQSKNNGAKNKASNAFVTKLNPSGTALIYSTYLGGSSATPNLSCYFCQNGDGAANIAIDGSGNAYVAGGTYSSDFPVTSGAFQKVNHATARGALNGFVAKLNPTGTALVYSTYLGGSGALGDVAYGLALDASGDVYLSGFTSSTDFPVTTNAYQSAGKATRNGAADAFLTEVNPTGSGLLYSTYFGGSGYPVTYNGVVYGYQGDYSYSLALDGTGNAYLTGTASSPDFPVTAGAYQTKAKAELGAFIGKFTFASATVATTTSLTSDGNPQKVGVKVTFTADVTPAKGTVVPTGSVSFTVDGGTATKVTLDDTGHAAYSTATLAAGSYAIRATYSGSTTYSTSNASLTEAIVNPPSISSVSRSYGAAGATVVITGTSFGASQGTSIVAFHGTPAAAASSWSATGITVVVPANAGSGNLIVTVGGEASNGIAFTIYPKPIISAISPTSGPVGTLVTITGTALQDGGGAGSVTFGSITAPFVSQSATKLQVKVPSGAVTGPIRVHANGAGVNSATFTVN